MNLIGSPVRKFSFFAKGKEFFVQARECSIMRKGFGLMFRKKTTDNLIFSFNTDDKRTFTGTFVFFSFLIIWLDNNNKVISCKFVKPFSTAILAPKKFRKTLELPLNEGNSKIIEYLVGKANI
jgi:uncharacterized membrane protein (UPF0127 family)